MALHVSMQFIATCWIAVGTAVPLAGSAISSTVANEEVLPLADDGLMIGAFNIQVFGKTKLAKPGIVDILVKIVQRYDILLIQEIRDSKNEAIYELLEKVNNATVREKGGNAANVEAEDDVKGVYDVIVSQRLGRTSSKEQYAYMFRKDKVNVSDVYQFDFPCINATMLNTKLSPKVAKEEQTECTDLFERPPFAVKFSAPGAGIPVFGMIGIHTSPYKAKGEVDALVQTYDEISAAWDLKDIIVAGDFNMGCRYVRSYQDGNISLYTDDRFTWLIDRCAITTAFGADCPYDRFVVAGDKLKQRVNEKRIGVYRYDKEMGLDPVMTRKVSDHFPVEMAIEGRRNYKNSRVTSSFAYSLEFTPIDVSNLDKVKYMASAVRRSRAYYDISILGDGENDVMFTATKQKYRGSVYRTVKLFSSKFPGILSNEVLATLKSVLDSNVLNEERYIYGSSEKPAKDHNIDISCQFISPFKCTIQVAKRLV
ncbi:unnamed protein product [Owenia fusiformis]|uniref:Endonuclease/exonuclease/phosphatase domain-containing protein n=1 Tax=Owenia fusiformis TaxID=6347 RepID=A0A8J1Y9X3_OWEFU|nr:unnamed protein product [Owenia fusiformis]